MTRARPRLATRLMLAQAIVVGIGTLALVVTAALVAPGLFHNHLADAGVNTPDVQMHAEEAFAFSFAIAVSVATAVSLFAAGLVSWFLVRRVSRPVEELARAAHGVAGGDYAVDVPDAAFSSELHELSASFTNMAHQLSETEGARVRLLADLAHELRTPLATLEGFIDGMEDGLLPSDAESWSTMRDQVDRLRRLSTDLREAAAAEEHALGIVLARLEAGSVATAALSAATPRFQAKGVDLDSRIPDAPLVLLGDSMRLQQVLANLLDNALRHTPPGGRVDVVVDGGGDAIRIRVIDTGEGIPSNELTSVFERFHRIDPSRVTNDGSGSGLGLTIARAIVVDHGGTLTAASEGLGSGTTMTITLPARQGR